MSLSTSILCLAVCFVAAELSIPAAGEETKQATPRGPAVDFKVIGHDLSGNSYVFVTDNKDNARPAQISVTKSWVRVRKAPEPMRIWALWNCGKFGRVMVEAVLERAKQNIERYRKSDIVIRVVDKDDKPVPNAHLEIADRPPA